MHDCDGHDLMQKYTRLFEETLIWLAYCILPNCVSFFVPHTPYRSSTPGRHWGPSVPRPPANLPTGLVYTRWANMFLNMPSSRHAAVGL